MQGSARLHSLSSCGGSWRDADAAHSQTPARRRTPAARVRGSTVLQKFLLWIWLSSPWSNEQFGVERKAEAPRGETYPLLQLEPLGRAAHSPPRPEPADPLLSSGGPHRPGRLPAASAMQSYKYDKAIVPESKNGGSPALNNNPRKGGSKRVLLICLDLFCLFMGERSPTGPTQPTPGPRPRAPPRCQPLGSRSHLPYPWAPCWPRAPRPPGPPIPGLRIQVGACLCFRGSWNHLLRGDLQLGVRHSTSEGVSSSSKIWREPVALCSVSESDAS